MSRDSSTQKRPRLAVVGGGYLGSGLAKALDREMDVTLIERASHLTHAPAMIRAMVDPRLLDRALIPYDRLLARGRVVRGEAVMVDDDGVTLADGTSVEADYVVLATGSTNLAPFRTGSGDIESLRADNDRWHRALTSARSVMIVGAGPVGTELAGEIAHAFPGRKVTLVSSDEALFSGFPPKLGRSLQSKLREMGIELIMGARAENLSVRSAPKGGRVILSSGQVIEADLVVPALGSRALAGLAESLPGAELDVSGRVKVDRWMRPSLLPNVFAAGDVAASGDMMTIVAVSRQKLWLENALKALHAGAAVNSIRPYMPWRNPPIVLPLGPERGNTFLMIVTLGDWVTRTMKGKDLFLTKYNRLLGRI